MFPWDIWLSLKICFKSLRHALLKITTLCCFAGISLGRGIYLATRYGMSAWHKYTKPVGGVGHVLVCFAAPGRTMLGQPDIETPAHDPITITRAKCHSTAQFHWWWECHELSMPVWCSAGISRLRGEDQDATKFSRLFIGLSMVDTTVSVSCRNVWLYILLPKMFEVHRLRKWQSDE